MTFFFLIDKSAKLANFDGFLQKCLKGGKVLFDGFISINKRIYMSNLPIFYKKYKKGKRGTQRVAFGKIMVFFKILTFKLYPFYFFVVGVKKYHTPSLSHKYHVNWSNRKKVMRS